MGLGLDFSASSQLYANEHFVALFRPSFSLCLNASSHRPFYLKQSSWMHTYVKRLMVIKERDTFFITLDSKLKYIV